MTWDRARRRKLHGGLNLALAHDDGGVLFMDMTIRTRNLEGLTFFWRHRRNFRRGRLDPQLLNCSSQLQPSPKILKDELVILSLDCPRDYGH